MQLIDSHCHLNMLDLSSFGGDLANVIAEAEKLGVTRFLSISTELSEHEVLLEIANRFPQVSISAGVHPNEDKALLSKDILFQQASHPKVIAIGETGLDYYRDYDKSIQQSHFATHIEIANTLNKPLIIHTRAAQQDTLAMMRTHEAYCCRGVMHCFTESWDFARSALDMGFYISFSGIITFKNATDLQEVVKKMPLDKLLVETDSPFLAPVPYRGKSNIPGYTRYVAEMVAALRHTTLDEIARETSQNFDALFAPASVTQGDCTRIPGWL